MSHDKADHGNNKNNCNEKCPVFSYVLHVTSIHEQRYNQQSLSDYYYRVARHRCNAGFFLCYWEGFSASTGLTPADYIPPCFPTGSKTASQRDEKFLQVFKTLDAKRFAGFCDTDNRTLSPIPNPVRRTRDGEKACHEPHPPAGVPTGALLSVMAVQFSGFSIRKRPVFPPFWDPVYLRP